MKKLYLCTLAFALIGLQGYSNTRLTKPAEGIKTTFAVFACTPIVPVSATATSGNAALAIDGNGGTRWESEFSDPQSITVDLGAVITVGSVTLDWETANAKDYFLRGSVDGITWVDIVTQVNMAAGPRSDVMENINAGYRYLRMDGVSRNTPYGYSIFEFKVCGPDDGAAECLALATTAAIASTGNATFAIDDNPGTRWESEFTDAQWLTVDLGAVTDVSTVTIDWEGANAKDYILQGSVDGTTWVDIETLTNMPAGARVDIIDGIEGEYRYLKMNGLLRNTPYGYSIWEFNACVFEEVTEPAECDVLAVASATATTGNAMLAIDDNPGTRWESAFTDAESITVDLGEVNEISMVTLVWEAANAEDYILKGSVDGIEWTDIAVKNDMAEGSRTDVIEDINAQYRYLMMQGVTRNTPYGYSLWEFDVCGGTVDVEPEPMECEPVVVATATSTSGNALQAIDDNPGTRWESEATDAQSITVDLGEINDVEGVILVWETANAEDYILKGSLDGTTWVDLAVQNDMAEGERTDEIDITDGEYRYLMMQGVTRNTPYGYSLWEFDVCGEALEVEPEPLECQPVVVASATATSGNATLAVDDNPGTRWESEATDAQSITVDLGEVNEVEGVILVWETANAEDYILKGSVDGTTWVDLAVQNDMAEGERTDEIDITDGEYRYLMMQGVTRNTPYGYSLWEFDICGEAIEVEPEPLECEPVVVASATATSGNATLAVDDNPGSRWESAFTDAESITVDLGMVTDVHGVILVWEAANAEDYILKGSVDGTTWVELAVQDDMAEGERTDEINITDGEYRYLMMQGVTRNTPYGYSLWEFDVCGEQEVIEPDPVAVVIPALIEAEDYVAMEGIDQEPTGDIGGGDNIGWIDANDWLEYFIDVPEAGDYYIDFRVASEAATGNIQVMTDGVAIGSIQVPNTGGWQNWQTITETVPLPAGEQTIRVRAVSAPFNLNWIQFREVELSRVDFAGASIKLFPNPAHGLLNVTVPDPTQLQIFTVTGAVVINEDMKAGNNIVNVEGLMSGVYIVKVGSKSLKLVID